MPAWIESAVVAVTAVILAWMLNNQSNNKAESIRERQKLEDKIRAVELELAKITTQVTPMWAQVLARGVETLHKPHPRYEEMDELMDLALAKKLPPEKKPRLVALLAERAKDMHEDISPLERLTAPVMIPLLELVDIDSESLAKTK